jgi:sporulation protein YlmC with PRC-barrel domain
MRLLAFPMGTKVLRRRLRADSKVVSQQQRRSLMLKTLALSASVLAFAGGLAFAETSSLSTGHWLASDVYKADVYDTSEQKVGTVTDLMIDSSGNVTAAIIGVGGFLGVGQKDVAIPFKELNVLTREGKEWLVLNRTKDELKTAPAFDKKAETNKM